MDSPAHERKNIEQYVIGQSPDGTTVSHAEKLSTTRVLGRDHDLWDVHASDGRWWVITEPTNLYSQDDFPSADLCLTFHVGIGARLISRQNNAQSRRVCCPSHGGASAGSQKRWTPHMRRRITRRSACDVARHSLQ